MKKLILLINIVGLSIGVSACQGLMEADARLAASGHIDQPAPPQEQGELEIPPVVEQVPIIAAPEPAVPLQTFTVVATNLPANELLFALARDARLNLDIDPSIDGRVSINAIDQTLPQILKRIARQVSLHFYIDGPNLVIQRDLPFTRIYIIDYLNMARTTTSSVSIETQISSGSSGTDGGNTGNSTTTVKNESQNNFWETLEINILAIASQGEAKGTVVSNRESGVISVRTTASAHEDVQRFVDLVVSSARRQVLIEATVVEVTLNDDFQAGVDWSRIANGNGWSSDQNLLGGTLGTNPFTSITYANNSGSRNITAALKALDSFGDVSVMSSPKIMALNNQTSVLKVADNKVYFEIGASSATDQSGNIVTTFTSDLKTVPVGFVMNVTPFITADNEVILNIRPTITRILRFVNDPNPDLASAGVVSPIPEIQVREMESVLRVASGNTAVIGGLMQDSVDKTQSGIPGLHKTPGLGVLFGTRSRLSAKTELVIFLRPRIINNANINTNLRDFKKYLNPNIFSGNAN